ncbi:hypothetical protein EJB05_33523 [Eragrostis curvula]|uniref:Uncharacterized protein n=1 Tax=Eragrostis curvula TaxID=38414 RepID=A0A5J9U1Q3_9POAL|nr:hypothetical protein EJB05_33523 [Eragrostis curvula]
MQAEVSAHWLTARRTGKQGRGGGGADSASFFFSFLSSLGGGCLVSAGAGEGGPSCCWSFTMDAGNAAGALSLSAATGDGGGTCCFSSMDAGGAPATEEPPAARPSTPPRDSSFYRCEEDCRLRINGMDDTIRSLVISIYKC